MSAKSCFARPAAASISYQLSHLHLASCISLFLTANTFISSGQPLPTLLLSSDARPLTLSSYRYLFTQLDPRSHNHPRRFYSAHNLVSRLVSHRSSTWPHHWTTRHSSSTCTAGRCPPALRPWTIWLILARAPSHPMSSLLSSISNILTLRHPINLAVPCPMPPLRPQAPTAATCTAAFLPLLRHTLRQSADQPRPAPTTRLRHMSP